MSQQPLSHSAHDVYNMLPSLAEADKLFPSNVQSKFLPKLNQIPIFQENKHYAVTLVHRHATLEPGEIMVSRGDVTRPERIENAGNVYASAWLTSGEAYEFTSDDMKYNRDEEPRHRHHPSDDLLYALRKSVTESGIQSFSGVGILGFRYISEIPDPDEIFLEKTYGRASFLTIIPAPGNFLNLRYAIPSCWLVAFIISVKQAVQTACACIKDTAHISVCSDDVTSEIKTKVDHPTKKTTTTTTTKMKKISTPVPNPPVTDSTTQTADGTQATTTVTTITDELETKIETTLSDDITTARTLSTTTTTRETSTKDKTPPAAAATKTADSSTSTLKTADNTKKKVVTTVTDHDNNKMTSTITTKTEKFKADDGVDIGPDTTMHLDEHTVITVETEVVTMMEEDTNTPLTVTTTTTTTEKTITPRITRKGTDKTDDLLPPPPPPPPKNTSRRKVVTTTDSNGVTKTADSN